MISLILGVLGIMVLWMGFIFFKDVATNKETLEESTNMPLVGAAGFTANFFDTLGIGSFAPLTAFFKAFKQVEDKKIPGTLNVSCTIPIAVQAFAFMTVIDVEIITLVSMLVAATVGAFFGAWIVSRRPERKIQLGMAIALLATAFLMFSGVVGWMPGGGDAIGLTGVSLAIAIIGNFILGALMTLGIGLYAPCMALVYFLGLSPAVAFPIMMGSCAFLMPVASVKFIKEESYNRKASIIIALCGIVGVLIAAYIVKSLPIDILRWLVIVVITYTSFTMFKSSMNGKAQLADY